MRRGRGGINHKDIPSTNDIVDFDGSFSVGKGSDGEGIELGAEEMRHVEAELFGGGSCKDTGFAKEVGLYFELLVEIHFFVVTCFGDVSVVGDVDRGSSRVRM